MCNAKGERMKHWKGGRGPSWARPPAPPRAPREARHDPREARGAARGARCGRWPARLLDGSPRAHTHTFTPARATHPRAASVVSQLLPRGAPSRAPSTPLSPARQPPTATHRATRRGRRQGREGFEPRGCGKRERKFCLVRARGHLERGFATQNQHSRACRLQECREAARVLRHGGRRLSFGCVTPCLGAVRARILFHC